MPSVFADTEYLIARLMPRDTFHKRARQLEREYASWTLVTSQPVLTELLAHVSNMGSEARLSAVEIVRRLYASSGVIVVLQTPDLFEQALVLYEQRLDKGYSLTDCMSMVLCREYGITDVLTNDHHFVQEGFVALFRG